MYWILSRDHVRRIGCQRKLKDNDAVLASSFLSVDASYQFEPMSLIHSCLLIRIVRRQKARLYEVKDIDKCASSQVANNAVTIGFMPSIVINISRANSYSFQQRYLFQISFHPPTIYPPPPKTPVVSSATRTVITTWWNALLLSATVSKRGKW